MIILDGVIAPGDADRLSAIVRDLRAARRRIAGLRLNSPGGAMSEGEGLADIVRRAKLATSVRSGQTCVSACVVVFAAGAPRLASHGAHVGVETAAMEGMATPAGESSAAPGAAMREGLGLSQPVVDRIIAMPPDQTYWLSAVDLVAMGAHMLDRPQGDRVATARPAHAPAKVAAETSVVQRSAEAPGAVLVGRRQDADRKADHEADHQADVDRAAQAAADARAATRQRQIADIARAGDQLADKATQCARQQLTGLVKSGEPAEVLANAAMTICSTDMSAMVESGVQEFRLEQNLASDSPAEGIARERIRAGARDRIVALAVQAKAGVGAFAAASN